MKRKVKILRVVTQAEVVPWHLQNFIVRADVDYDLYITGNLVSRYKTDYPSVNFVDNEIQRKISFFTDMKALYKLVVLCRTIRPDIIHSIMPKSGLLSAIAGRLSGVPVRIHTYTGQIWSTKEGFSRIFFKILDKVIFRLNTACLTDSPSQSAFLRKNGFLNKGAEIPYLGEGSLTGVDLKQYNYELVKTRDQSRLNLGIKTGEFVFGFFARKSISKGISYLLESFDKIGHLPGVRLLMVGADESEGQLDQLLIKFKHNAPQIVNIDNVESHERCLAVCDVLCCPSSSEGFGSIVIEAAALAIPTVGFDVLGLSDSVKQDRTGILVPYGDIDGFAKALTHLYSNSDYFQQMRENARVRATKIFSADLLYKYQKDFYTQCLLESKIKD